MDTTFKTNVYGRQLLNVVSASPMNTTTQVSIHFLDRTRQLDHEKALRWLRLQLEKSGSGLPRCIVTDREDALLNALDAVFSEVKTILYEWHINQDIKAKLHTLGPICRQVRTTDTLGKVTYVMSKATNEFMARWFEVTRSRTEDEFEERRQQLHTDFPSMISYLIDNW